MAVHCRPVRHARRFPRVAIALGCIALAACSKDHTGPADQTGPAPTGALAVTVTTPAGVTGAVAVRGPNAFNQIIMASKVIAGVPTGVFTIVADSVVMADSVVGSRIDTGVVSQPSVTVDAGDTARTSVTYAFKQRRGVIWVSTDAGGRSLRAFGADSLRPPGGSTPLDTISGGLSDPNGMAFDPSGNLWVANEASSVLVMFTGAQLATGGAVAPARILSDTTLDFVLGLRFDPSGNMWVMTDNGLLGYTPAQQSAGSSQTAAVIISGHLLAEPIDMAFDSSGNAWVSDYTSNVLMRFTAAQLATTGTPVPVDTITATAGSLDHPAGLATDKSGNLWVANYNGGTIVAFSPSQLDGGGGPTPLITLSPAGANTLWGIAFDQEGGLWVGNYGADNVLGLSRAQIASSGSPTANVTINSSDGPAYVLFDPATPMVPGAGHAARVRGSAARPNGIHSGRADGAAHAPLR